MKNIAPSPEVVLHLPLFRGMEAASLSALLAEARIEEYQKGAVFLAQGDLARRGYVVLNGWCGAVKGNVEGHESILQLFQTGDLFPESNSRAPVLASPVNFQALTPLRLLSLSPQAIHQILALSPVFSANMLACFTRQNEELRDHIEQLTLRSAEQRIGRFLLQIRFLHDDMGGNIVLPFDKFMIAAYLGIKPETLSRTLQFFKERGFVAERNHLIVPDRHALCDYCDQTTMQSCRFAHDDACTYSSHGDALLS